MARVLLVEDEKNLRELISQALAASGHDLKIAENGVQAIQTLEAHDFDAVISDITMPEGVSGIDLAEYIRAKNLPVKIILVSGHALAQLPRLPDTTVFLPKRYRIQQLLDLLDGS